MNQAKAISGKRHKITYAEFAETYGKNPRSKMQLQNQTEIKAQCPVCKKSWIVRTNHFGLGHIFDKDDFEMAFRKHLMSHVIRRNVEIATQPWVYGGSLNG